MVCWPINPGAAPEQGFLAGILLRLTTIKPQMTLLAVVYLLF